MHPDTEVRVCDGGRGLGVFATSLIPKGTIVYIQDSLDIVLESSAIHDLPTLPAAEVKRLSYKKSDGTFVLCWDHSKYTNHCCFPNSLSTGWGFEIALKEIHPGDEITDDYGLFNDEEPMELLCDKKGCRGCLNPEDFDLYVKDWDEALQDALGSYRSCEQPLLELITEDIVTELNTYLDTGRGYRSVSNLRCI